MPSKFRWSARSKKNLEGVHSDLVMVANRALQLTVVDFVVISGVRTEAQQEELYKAGASKTMRSRHLTGHAIDVMPLVAKTEQWHKVHYFPLAEAFSQASKEFGVPIRWGGTWQRLKHQFAHALAEEAEERGGWDFGHFELPKSPKYP